MLYNRVNIEKGRNMMRSIKLYANAKINLFLDIESKRDDGYHNIVSLMQSVGLHDVITVSFEESEEKIIEVSVNDPKIPTNEKNIAYKAADKLIDKGKVRIKILKSIPSPAGLAGGSSDAAAVIYALKAFGCTRVSDEEIIRLAASIGADVPFCLVGGSKRITGIGDVIENIPDVPEMDLVIALDGEGVSTPVAYRMLDDKYGNFESYSVKRFDFERFSSQNVYNVFEEVVLDLRPCAKALKEKMYALGASSALMSGSGPAIVGIFDSYESAESCAEAIRSSGAFAVACKTVKKGIIEA